MSADGLRDDQDWCPSCERVTEWDGEDCRSCGYEWGTG